MRRIDTVQSEHRDGSSKSKLTILLKKIIISKNVVEGGSKKLIKK
jgi:hypothetical protein